jgi:glucan biosynthesis protein C
MGFFTLVSAYFVPGSLLRKGRARFTSDRLVRLGIPLLFWVLILNPLLLLILTLGGAPVPLPVAAFLNPVTGAGLGPMWFVFFLIVATFAYLLWTAVKPAALPGDHAPRPFPGFASLFALGILLAVVTAVVRIFWPMGSMWLFSFQLGFFPQYVVLFIAGIYAAHNNWLDNIPARVGKACAAAALLLVAVLPVIVYLVINSPAGLSLITGGLHWQALFYALWEQMTCVMIITTMLWVFSLRLNRQGPVTRAMGGDSYTVYVFHPLVLVSLSLVFAGIALPQLAKFIIVLTLAICLSFALAHVIRAVPGVKRVL